MKSYVFFIGGTGARTLTAFLHICASGMVRLDDTVRLMMMDADMSNGACARAQELYRLYCTNYDRFHTQDVKKALDGRDFPAFYTRLDMPPIVTPMKPDATNLDLLTAGGGNGKALRWLYTPEEINEDLSKGFYAHPNIGCVYFQDMGGNLDSCTKQIKSILTKEDVRVVIVGSMFGGTGAAGIPSVLKMIQRACTDGQSDMMRQRLHFCGVLITPYFKIPDPSDADHIHIDSEKFYDNTQSALNYYRFRYEKDFESIYLVGQNELQLLNNTYVDGGDKQENKPHVVELIAAAAIKDFLQKTDGTADGRKVFARILDMEAKKPELTWDNLDTDLSCLADMLRTQILLKAVFCPYVDKPHGLFGARYPWYRAFHMSEPGCAEELHAIMQYTDLFLEYMYDIQYQLPDGGYGNLRRDDRIALVGQPIEDIMTVGELGEDYIYTCFEDLLDTRGNPQNLTYRYTKAKAIVDDVGTIGAVDRTFPNLRSLGLFMQTYKLAMQRTTN